MKMSAILQLKMYDFLELEDLSCLILPRHVSFCLNVSFCVNPLVCLKLVLLANSHGLTGVRLISIQFF
jgi:hypothetical protein